MPTAPRAVVATVLRAIVCAACVLGAGCAAGPRALLPDPSDRAPEATGPGPANVVVLRASAPPPPRVAVVDTTGEDLSAKDAAVVTELIQIRVERPGRFAVVRARDPSLPFSDVASAERVDVVVGATTHKLGDALVVTITVFDARRATTARDAVSAQRVGELADKLAPVVDALLQPIIASAPAAAAPPPDIEARIKAQLVEVCTDRGAWYFCDAGGRAMTENEVVRRYRAETNRHDADFAEVDRVIDWETWGLLLGGGTGAALSAGLLLFLITTPTGDQLMNQSDGVVVIAPTMLGLGSVVAFVFGALDTEDHMDDGTELMHELDIDQGRAVARRTNTAVKRRVLREAGLGE